MSCHCNERQNNGYGGSMQPSLSNGEMPSALNNTSPIPPMPVFVPTTVKNPCYTAGFMKKHIGENMRVEFLIGTNGALIDRVGLLMKVGATYIVLKPYLSNDQLMCDLFSIKFVTIYE